MQIVRHFFSFFYRPGFSVDFISFFSHIFSPMTETWETILQLLVKGDKQAYATVFREFYGPLVCYARRFVMDQDVAEDIVQGFFCHFWENRKNLPAIHSFKTYFYTAIRNRSLNYLRDKHAISIEGFDIRKEEDFLMEMMEEEIYRELYAAIRTLPDKCRQIFLLKLAGKENSEIACEMNISEETVRSQLRRGREILQKRLTGLSVLSALAYICL